MESRVTPLTSAPAPRRNNFFSSVGIEVKPLASNQVLAPPSQSMDCKEANFSIRELDFDGRSAISNRTMLGEIRSCGEGVCYSTNPAVLPNTWSQDILYRSFTCYMLPTTCISQPCYWASKKLDGSSYSCMDGISGLFLCPVASANLLCSSALVAISAPCVYGFDMSASACNINLIPYSQDINEKIAVAIREKNLHQVVKFTEKKTERNALLINHCHSIMNLMAEKFDQAITLKQRVQLYSHMARRLRCYHDKNKYRMGIHDHAERIISFIKILLPLDPSNDQIKMLDLVLQLERNCVSEGMWRDIAFNANKFLWDQYGNKGIPIPLWKEYDFEKSIRSFYKILCVLKKYNLLNRDLENVLTQLEVRMARMECRLAFCSGSNQASSSVQTFFKNSGLFDQTLVSMIFDDSGLSELKKEKAPIIDRKQSISNVKEESTLEISFR